MVFSPRRSAGCWGLFRGAPVAIVSVLLLYLASSASAAPVAGFGNSLEFSTDDYILIPNSPSLSLSGADSFTIAMWIRSGGGQGTLYRMDAGYGEMNIYIYTRTDNRLTFGLGRQSYTWDWQTSVGSVSTTGWTHVAFVKETNSSRIYINGQLDSQDTVHSMVMGAAPSTRSTYLGVDVSTWSAWFGGRMDEVCVWREALAPQVIDAWRYRRPDLSQSAFTNLVLNLRMDEGAGAIAADSSLATNHGTLASMEETDWKRSTIVDAATIEGVPVSGTLAGSDVAGSSGDGTSWLLAFAVSAQGAKGTAVVTGVNGYIYTPSPDAFGTDTFQFVVSDTAGVASAAGTVQIVITGTPDAPVAVADFATTRQDEMVTINVLSNDYDVDDDALSVTSATVAAHGDVVVGGSFQNLKYTPDAGWSGTDTFSYVVADGTGLFATGQVTVVVGSSYAWPNGNNSYDGDGVADLAVYDGLGHWYIRTLLGGQLAWATNWGFPGAVCVPGDYDGDGATDLALYDEATGNWYIRRLTGQVIAWATNWGFPGAVPVPGDYSGDGRADLAVYNENTGDWYIRTVQGSILAWATNWGYVGAMPVAGDYDGDGLADLAVYDESVGNWYVRRLTGQLVGFATNWGYAGTVPVPGDYDGDGAADLSVYDEVTGNWYIRRLGGSIILWAGNWGFLGAVPVPGDYDADGRADMAVYAATDLAVDLGIVGNWYIRTVDGTTLLYGENWGTPGMMPADGGW